MKPDKHKRPDRQGVVTDPFSTQGNADQLSPSPVSPETESGPSQNPWSEAATDTSSTPRMPGQLPPIVPPPAVPPQGGDRGSDAPDTLRPQITAVPGIVRFGGQPTPCKICGEDTHVAGADIVPICENCAMKVLPQAIAHTVVLHGTFGPTDLGLKMLLGQIELAYWGEVTKFVEEAQEYRKRKLSGSR